MVPGGDFFANGAAGAGSDGPVEPCQDEEGPVDPCHEKGGAAAPCHDGQRHAATFKRTPRNSRAASSRANDAGLRRLWNMT